MQWKIEVREVKSSTTSSIPVTIVSINTFIIERSGFPFYTVGRFENAICVGSNQLTGTCVLKGQCDDLGGTQTGNFACSGSKSKQAQCCICEWIIIVSLKFNFLIKHLPHSNAHMRHKY